jgi:hypothetical protein
MKTTDGHWKIQKGLFKTCVLVFVKDVLTLSNNMLMYYGVICVQYTVKPVLKGTYI